MIRRSFLKAAAAALAGLGLARPKPMPRTWPSHRAFLRDLTANLPYVLARLEESPGPVFYLQGPMNPAYADLPCSWPIQST